MEDKNKKTNKVQTDILINLVVEIIALVRVIIELISG